MLLKGDKIWFRALEKGDATFLYEVENDTENWLSGFNTLPYSLSTLIQYIDNQTCDIYADKQIRFVAIEKRTGKNVGLIDLYDFNPLHKNAWIGIYIQPQYRGKGLGKEALQIIEEYAFQHINVKNLLCYVAEDNTPSINLFTSRGFSKVGEIKDYYKRRNSTYVNAYIFQKQE